MSWSTPTPTSTGKISFAIPSVQEPCETAFKVFRPPLTPSPDSTLLISSTSRKSRLPLIVLHGGPGASHHYLLSLADLASSHGVTVIFYDQIGCGESTRLPEKEGDLAFWSEDLFLDQLESVLAHFGLGGEDHGDGDGKVGEYDLFGQSWGAMLAARFASSSAQKVHPRLRGLRRLVLANPLSSARAWVKEAYRQRGLLSAETQEVLDRCEREGRTSEGEYQAAVGAWHGRHTIRANPVPEEVKATMFDETVRNAINGSHEFDITGSMKDWDITEHISAIHQPTLLVNGRYDTACDESLYPFFNRLPNVKWVHFSESSHMPRWEERTRYMEIVGGFLTASP